MNQRIWSQWSQRLAWDFVLALVVVLNMIHLARVLPARVYSCDFNHYYVSSRLLLEGQNPYRTSLAKISEEYGFEHSDVIPVATNPPLGRIGGPMSDHFWWQVGVSLGFLSILAAYTFCARTRRDENVQFSVLCVAMLAGGPTAWGYYFVLLMLPVVMVAISLAESLSLRRVLTFAAALLAMNSQGPWADSSPIVNILINYLPLYGMCGLCVLLITTPISAGLAPNRLEAVADPSGQTGNQHAPRCK